MTDYARLAHACADELNAMLDRREREREPNTREVTERYQQEAREVLQRYGIDPDRDNALAHSTLGPPHDPKRRFVRHVGGAWFIQFDIPHKRWKAVYSATGLVTVEGEEGGTFDAREKP